MKSSKIWKFEDRQFIQKGRSKPTVHLILPRYRQYKSLYAFSAAQQSLELRLSSKEFPWLGGLPWFIHLSDLVCRTGTARRQTLARRGSKGFRLQTWHSGATIGRILTTRSQCDLVLFHHRKPNARCKMGAQGNLDYFGSKTLQQMQLVRIGSDRSCEVCFRLMVFLDSIWSFPVLVVIQCHTNQIWPDKISSKPNFDLVDIFQKFKTLVKGLG